MSEAQYLQFVQRVRRIDRHHRKLAKGYVTSMNHDGLVIARPHQKSSGLPVRGLFLTLATLLVFKAFLLAQLGPDGYGDRMALLENGTMFEKIGAYAMKPDPVTQWLATRFHGIF